MKNFAKTVDICLEQLCDCANEKANNGFDIDTAIGEAVIGGIEYQIQLSLKSDKKTWCGKDEIRISEVVKIHPNA